MPLQVQTSSEASSATVDPLPLLVEEVVYCLPNGAAKARAFLLMSKPCRSAHAGRAAFTQPQHARLRTCALAYGRSTHLRVRWIFQRHSAGRGRKRASPMPAQGCSLTGAVPVWPDRTTVFVLVPLFFLYSSVLMDRGFEAPPLLRGSLADMLPARLHGS